MISIIICLRTPSISTALEVNILEKIGVPYEIIGIDNSSNKYSIFEAYNEGIAKSSYDILCFIHDDIKFHTSDWGQKIADHLKKDDVGIVGVCGGSTLSKVPASWSLYDQKKYILQGSAHGDKSVLHITGHEKGITASPVVVLDGVFLCAKKELFQKISFDDKTFNGFHSYDLDICAQAHMAGFKNYAINDVLIEHFSNGHHNKQWVVNSMKLSDKWSSLLPISINPTSTEHREKIEFSYMTGHFAKCLIRAGYDNKKCLQIITNYLSHSPKSDEKMFKRKIYLKILLVRLTKNPKSFFKASK